MKDLHTPEKESESVVDWFKHNHMIANPDNFQAIFKIKVRKKKFRNQRSITKK